LNPSDEALRKAGLSTLIKDEELKQAWLLAATAEGYQSQGDQGRKQAQDAVKQSLNLLKNSKAQVDPKISHQVSAFVYLMAAQLNNDKEKDYRTAYKEFKDSKVDLSNPNAQSQFLTEREVAPIHVGLIESIKNDKIFKTQVEESLKSLPSLIKINDLLAEKKWGQADEATRVRIHSRFISCPIIRAIDDLWVYNSKGHFGFSVQKQIYLEMGNKLDIYGESDTEEKVSGTEEKVSDTEENNFMRFATRVGWTSTYPSGLSVEQFSRGFFPIVSGLQDDREKIPASNGGMFGETGWLLRDDSREERNWARNARRRATIYLNRRISYTASCEDREERN
jgi:hypothetical protein